MTEKWTRHLKKSNWYKFGMWFGLWLSQNFRFGSQRFLCCLTLYRLIMVTGTEFGSIALGKIKKVRIFNFRKSWEKRNKNVGKSIESGSRNEYNLVSRILVAQTDRGTRLKQKPSNALYTVCLLWTEIKNFTLPILPNFSEGKMHKMAIIALSVWNENFFLIFPKYRGARGAPSSGKRPWSRTGRIGRAVKRRRVAVTVLGNFQ